MTRPGAASPSSSPATPREALLGALGFAAEYNRSDVVPPAAVLWTDKERRWEAVVPGLRERLPLLTLGPYDREALTGPAIWLRCALAGALPEVELPDGTPVVYLPGVSRSDLRAVEDCPKDLQPLAELQYRGVIFSHPNGRDWTPAAFLGKRLGVEVAGGAAAQGALARALPELLKRPVHVLRDSSPLQATDLDELMVPDPERELLLWLDEPGAYANIRPPEARAAFGNLCAERYGFDPESDGELEAARLLAGGQGYWRAVWERYAEAPRRYPNLPSLLDRVEPGGGMTLFDEASAYRPHDNRAEEGRLREALLELENQTAASARARIGELEAHHRRRRGWVWAELGQSPLALALAHLSALAEATSAMPGAGTAHEIAEQYVSGYWKADDEALRSLACAGTEKDSAAVRVAVRSVYSEWLEVCARRFQRAVSEEPLQEPEGLDPEGPRDGVCTVFTDGLRYDLAQRLESLLVGGRAKVEGGWRFTALPGVTPTAKPLLSPVSGMLGPAEGFNAAANGSKVTSQSLKRLLSKRGYQVLAHDEVGDPSGAAWTEYGDLDELGHGRGWKMAFDVERSLRALAERVIALIGAGWHEVRVVTDHGWLLLPGGLGKATLPEHLTSVRKGRCARLKPGAATDQQVVPWSLDPQVSVAVAPGTSAYEAGKEYEHGGLSPQECVVPVLTVTASGITPSVATTIGEVRWAGLRCRVRVQGAPDGAKVDLRSRAADPSTSIAASKSLKEDTASLPVADDTREGDAAIVVVLDPEGRVLAQASTVVGG